MRVKIGLPWLLLVLMKLTNREIRSDEIVSFREAFELCRAEPAAEVCELLLDRLQPPGPRPPPQHQRDIVRDALEKRRQKTVFSSWGGKRQNAFPRDGKRPAFSSWGGKRAQGRPKQTFSSWGGKRSGYDYGTDDGGYDEGASAALEEHRLEKRDLKDATDVVDKGGDKKNYYHSNGMTRGMRALFTIFSGWPRDTGTKAAVRYSGVKSIRGSTGFFPWGGKRDPE